MGRGQAYAVFTVWAVCTGAGIVHGVHSVYGCGHVGIVGNVTIVHGVGNVRVFTGVCSVCIV